MNLDLWKIAIFFQSEDPAGEDEESITVNLLELQYVICLRFLAPKVAQNDNYSHFAEL